ncbi:amino acid ABC transporter ATP-binding protein [Liquorilactobacillus aquaticus]|nr:amino acid ABC transporter ATP-binding protein [Liquorilactobacillus aquaticus]
MLKIRGLKKSYAENEILKGIDLDVKKGDVITIIGPSGAGKTTLLRNITTLESADSGKIEFENIQGDYSALTRQETKKLRQSIGFVFQNYNLFNNKTALQNVMEGLLTAKRMPKQEARTEALKALERVGLLEYKDQYPVQLSGGQQQRVGIARAIALKPKVIFFDEPTSALDPELVGEVLQVMRSLAHEGTTMVIVTHQMRFAQEISNKIVFMVAGRVVESGTAQAVFENPRAERTRQFLAETLVQY